MSMTGEKYIIDASGKRVGRVASEAAVRLIGKDTPGFSRHLAGSRIVQIVNASQIALSAHEKERKTFTAYSGYPGGLRRRKMKDLIARRGYGEVLRKAVIGMLPRNRLRKARLKRLIIQE